jgi:hypothetical protein
MFRTVRKTLLTLAVVALLTPVAKVAFAQNLYNISHFDTAPQIALTSCGQNAAEKGVIDCNSTDNPLPTIGTPTLDNTVRLVVGSSFGAPGAHVGRCANIYVYDDDEQLVECCACAISANGFLQLSTEDDLTANPFDSAGHTLGLIKVVSSLSSPCSNDYSHTSPFTTAGAGYTPAANVREWIQNVPIEPLFDFPTRVQNIVETQFLAVPFASPAELSALQTRCGNVVANGSGKALCTCGSKNFGNGNSFEAPD